VEEELDLEPIKKRAREAEEGPWVAGKPSYRKDGPPYRVNITAPGRGTVAVVFQHATKRVAGSIWPTVPDEPGANAEFTAHARTDIPALIAEVERLRRIIGG